MTQILIVTAFAFLLPFLLHRLFFQRGMHFLQVIGMERKNFAGRKIPTAAGLFLLLYNTATTLLLFAIVPSSPMQEKGLVFYLVGSVAMALWGWQDDASSEKEVKGFRGHLAILWKERRMTSGLLKAWGGGSTALIVSLAISDSVGEVLLHTGILALSTNLINLFDLRPGRAIKAFWLILIGPLLTGIYHIAEWYFFVPIIVSTLLIYRHDIRAALMIGDTGSNYLGFLAGYAMILTLSFPLKIAVLAGLVLLHIAAEFVSFSQMIYSVRWLRRADEWGRRI